MKAPFPTDASGESFQLALAALRRIRPESRGRLSKPLIVKWLEERMPSDCPAEFTANAIVGGYHLLAVEMHHFAMWGVGDHVPRISWSIGEDDDDTDPMTGGPAPSLAVAMQRAEQALRVYLRIED